MIDLPVESNGQHGDTALHGAVRGGKLEAAVQLIAAGADVDAKDEVRTGVPVGGSINSACYLRRMASLQWNWRWLQP